MTISMKQNPNLATGKKIVEEVCHIPNLGKNGAAANVCTTCSERATCNKVHNPRLDGKTDINMTDGDIVNYGEFDGYNSVIAPATITLDLEKVEMVQTIQFLLWDNCGRLKTENCNRKYQYRLLVSEDLKEWRVLFDTFRDGFCGWQRFDLSEQVPMRYIRFHALTVNDKTPPPFMVVEMEAYATELQHYEYRFMPTLHVDLNVSNANKVSTTGLSTLNEKTHHKLSAFFTEIEKNLAEDSQECQRRGRLALKAQLEHLTKSVSSIHHDVNAYEDAVNEIKSKILGRTDEEIIKSRRWEKVSFWSGVIGIATLLASIVEQLF